MVRKPSPKFGWNGRVEGFAVGAQVRYDPPAYAQATSDSWKRLRDEGLVGKIISGPGSFHGGTKTWDVRWPIDMQWRKTHPLGPHVVEVAEDFLSLLP